jgi:hypothetical protein
MTLREEIRALQAGGQRIHGDEINRLADRYGVDTHEIAFIWECASEGNLDLVRGPVIDKEAVDDGR